jgi:hypothetical protein
LQGPFTDSLASTVTSLTDWNESQADTGRAGDDGERGHRDTLTFPWLVTASEEASLALGPRFNPAVASHFLWLSLIPLSLPCDLLSSLVTFSPWSFSLRAARCRVIQLSCTAVLIFSFIS